MTYIQRLIENLEARIWTFIRAIISANHDYPYHDSLVYENEGEEAVTIQYIVGSKNIDAHGDQKKLFVSKRMNIWTSNPSTYVQFNDAHNVHVYLERYGWFDGSQESVSAKKEFYTNISMVFITVPASAAVIIYCEGVLPQEARDAE